MEQELGDQEDAKTQTLKMGNGNQEDIMSLLSHDWDGSCALKNDAVTLLVSAFRVAWTCSF